MDPSREAFFAVLAGRASADVATGILMGRHGLDAAGARCALYDAADHWGSTVAAAARRIIDGADAGP